MIRLYIVLILLSLANIANCQAGCINISYDDLTVNGQKMQQYISTEFMKKSPSLTDGGARGVFWMKLTYGNGELRQMDVSTGATSAVSRFFLEELKNIQLSVANKSLPAEFNLIIPVRFWLHATRSSETREIVPDQANLLHFFSGSQSVGSKCYVFLPELLVTGPIQ